MNKIEEALQKIFQDHRVIFWYDEKEELLDQFNTLDLSNIEKIHVDKNEFEIKYIVNKEKPKNKFLLYFTREKLIHEENWLLDMELANHVFHTDQEAMFLQKIGLDYHFKELVTEHIELFKAKERRNKLKDLLGTGDSHQEIRYKMLAVVFAAENIHKKNWWMVLTGHFTIRFKLIRISFQKLVRLNLQMKMNNPASKYIVLFLFFLGIISVFQACSGCSQSSMKHRTKNISNQSSSHNKPTSKQDYQPEVKPEIEKESPVKPKIQEQPEIKENEKSTPPVFTSGNKTVAQMFKELQKGVFMVFAFDNANDLSGSQGSGFLINEKGVGITNAHVLEGHKNYMIKTSDGEYYKITDILKTSDQDDNDYVIFKIDTKGN